MNCLLIFLGGGLGALARFGLSQWIASLAAIRFPLGILICNLVGCLLIGYAVGQTSKNIPDWVGPFLIIGFLGGFTTFSTFASDSLNHFHAGEPHLALGNIVLSVVPGLAAVWLGLRLAAS